MNANSPVELIPKVLLLEAVTKGDGRRHSDNREEMTDFHKQTSFLSINGALNCCSAGLDGW